MYRRAEPMEVKLEVGGHKSASVVCCLFFVLFYMFSCFDQNLIEILKEIT